MAKLKAAVNTHRKEEYAQHATPDIKIAAKTHSKPALPRRAKAPVFGKIKVGSAIISALLVVFAACLPMLSLFFANQVEVPFIQAFVPAAGFALVGLIAFTVILLTTSRPYFSGVISAVFAYLLANFRIIRNLSGNFVAGQTEQILSIAIFAVIIAALFFVLFKFAKPAFLGPVVKLGCVLLASLMLFSFIIGTAAFADEPIPVLDASLIPTRAPSPTPIAVQIAAPTVAPTGEPEKLNATQTPSKSSVYPPVVQSTKKPNVYFILLDEYSPFLVTGKYFNFNNSFFRNFLQERNINISDSSLCNNADTVFCTAELMKLEAYTKRPNPSTAYKTRKPDAALFKSFNDIGYKTLKNITPTSMYKIPALSSDKSALIPLEYISRPTPEPTATVAPENDEPTPITQTPSTTPTPTITPADTSFFDDVDLTGEEDSWIDTFFRAQTFDGRTMYDLAVEMSILSLFIEPKPPVEQLDDDTEDFDDDIDEPDLAPGDKPTDLSAEVSEDTEDIDADDYDDGNYESEPEGVDHGEEAELDADAGNDPVPYDKLVKPKKNNPYYASITLRSLAAFEQFNTMGFAEPTVFYSYFRCPHVPFYFRADGSMRRTEQYYSWRNPNVYIGQLKYMTTHLMHVIDVILNSDPDSVIVIQSDHGMRYKQLKFPTKAKKSRNDQYFVLNLVYYRGEILNIEGLSPINTLRTVLTKLGNPMPLTPDPRAKKMRGQMYGIPDDDPRLKTGL